MKTKFLFLLAIVFFISCDNNNDETIESSIIGNWIYTKENTTGDIITYNRVGKIETPKHGIMFKADNQFIERIWDRNTTPYPYNYTGQWQLRNKILSITKDETAYPSTNNTIETTNNTIEKIIDYSVTDYEIIELTSTTLRLKKFDISNSELYDIIVTMAKSVSCNGNMKNWKTTPIGYKSCGGPTHYIAYNDKMENVDEFLRLVEKYTERERKATQKSDMVSDCMVVSPPTKIECFEGEPIIIGAY